MNVKISPGNTKMGQIPSVSLPAGETCRHDCGCIEKCYAKKLERLRPAVRNAYKHNLNILTEEPDTYWREVEAAIMTSRFFRFHVSGDIPHSSYFIRMIEVAKRNQHCEILCFTKRYGIVNGYLFDTYINTPTLPEGHSSVMLKDMGILLPKNLHIIMSAWRGTRMHNPFGFPEAHVRYRDGTTTAAEGAHECGGNCAECARTGEGCWTLKRGEQIIFNEH